MQSTLLLMAALTLVMAVPSEFDMRVHPSVLKYADYTLNAEGICSGYAWAKELAQVLSNAASFVQKERVVLSAQHLLECTETDEDKCYSSTKGNILKAIEQASKNGLTTSDCYLNRPLEHPSDFCKPTCADGFDFDFLYKAKFQKYGSVAEIFELYRKSDSVTAFAILKVDDSFNFYSSFKAELSASPSEVYEYRIAEIVGWKNAQKKLTLRAGPGLFWGYNGYVDLDLQKYGHYVDSYYSVSLTNSRNIRIDDQ
jgi:hypothetical protein